MLIGCMPMAEISIQVIEPARITLPPYISQVSFSNHSYIPSRNPVDTAELTIKEIFILDTIVNNHIFMGIRNGLNNSPLFDLDSIEVMQFRRTDTQNFLAPFSKSQLEAIKKNQRADALISLEYYNMKDTFSVDQQDMEWVASRKIISSTVWRIYDLTKDSLFDEYMLADTAEWFIAGEDTYMLMESLPEYIQSLRMASYNAGYKYGQKISPSWYDVPRFYHTSGGKAMRQARRKAAARDWKGASEIWKVLAYQEKERIAAKASFNMALVCEMEDLLIPALDWAIKSYFIRQDRITKEYIDQLKVRYMQQRVVKDQLPADN
jgi:hypothetical protein